MILPLVVTAFLFAQSAYSSSLDPYVYEPNFEDYQQSLKSETYERTYELAIYGDPHAKYIISEDLGSKKQYEEARRWCEEASDAGSLEAMERLSLYYVNGIGGPRNYEGLYKIYHYLAVELKMPKYIYLMGALYDRGFHVKKDLKQAFSWYYLASEEGYIAGQFAVGEMYEWGIGVKEDKKKAIHYYNLAAKQGHQEATEAFSRLSKVNIVKPERGKSN